MVPQRRSLPSVFLKAGATPGAAAAVRHLRRDLFPTSDSRFRRRPRGKGGRGQSAHPLGGLSDLPTLARGISLATFPTSGPESRPTLCPEALFPSGPESRPMGKGLRTPFALGRDLPATPWAICFGVRREQRFSARADALYFSILRTGFGRECSVAGVHTHTQRATYVNPIPIAQDAVDWRGAWRWPCPAPVWLNRRCTHKPLNAHFSPAMHTAGVCWGNAA